MSSNHLPQPSDTLSAGDRRLRHIRSAPAAHSLSPISHLVSQFPRTRYYGSKRRLLSWLYSEFRKLHFTSVLDVFGGTACVSQLFRLMNKKVTYHDALRFNVDVARTVLSDTLPLDASALTAYLDSVVPRCGVVSRNFNGIFFLNEENLWIDGYMNALDSSRFDTNQISLLRYLLYQACLKKRPFNIFHRANLSLRTNPSVQRSFGNSTTWEKSFREHIMLAYRELSSSRIRSKHKAQIIPPTDALAVVRQHDLIYIDPPYVSQNESYNRDNYWRRYHFLEGLSIYEDWEKRIDLASDIRMMAVPNHFVSWSRKATFRDLLFQLIKLHNHSTVALSYVDNGYPAREEIQDFFEQKFAKVYITGLRLPHALSRKRTCEYLWVGVPK